MWPKSSCTLLTLTRQLLFWTSKAHCNISAANTPVNFWEVRLADRTSIHNLWWNQIVATSKSLTFRGAARNFGSPERRMSLVATEAHCASTAASQQMSLYACDYNANGTVAKQQHQPLGRPEQEIRSGHNAGQKRRLGHPKKISCLS